MPGRLEYETEYENDAESLVKDMEFGKVYQFGGDEQPAAVEESVAKKELPKGEVEEKDEVVTEEDEGELQLKLAVLEMFNERYDRRVAAKEVIFDRGLMNYKTVSSLQNERNSRLTFEFADPTERTQAKQGRARSREPYQGLCADTNRSRSRSFRRRTFAFVNAPFISAPMTDEFVQTRLRCDDVSQSCRNTARWD